MKRIRELGVDTTGVGTLQRSQFVGDEIAKLREQLANMNNNMKEQTTQGGPPNMNTVTDASVSATPSHAAIAAPQIDGNALLHTSVPVISQPK